MMTGDPDTFSLGQRPNLSAIVFDQPALISMRSSAHRVSAKGQSNVAFDLAGDFGATPWGVAVIHFFAPYLAARENGHDLTVVLSIFAAALQASTTWATSVATKSARLAIAKRSSCETSVARPFVAGVLLIGIHATWICSGRGPRILGAITVTSKKNSGFGARKNRTAPKCQVGRAYNSYKRHIRYHRHPGLLKELPALSNSIGAASQRLEFAGQKIKSRVVIHGHASQPATELMDY
jgi:hypothetical protein